MNDLGKRFAAALLLAAALGCSSLGRGDGATTNIAWTFERNLVLVDATVGGRAGSFIVGTANQRTILDPGFQVDAAARGRVGVNLGDRFSATVEPLRSDLGGVADGILGGDVFRRRSLGIDYQRGLLVLGERLDPITEGVRFRFTEIPRIRVFVDGAESNAVVDSSSPDTLLLPAGRYGAEGRRTVSLRIGATEFARVDARVAPVDEIRIGNRILAHFLVTVDYPRREVTLWRHGPAPSPSAP
jgi:hypothetical protein